jgi:hypothetical protein
VTILSSEWQTWHFSTMIFLPAPSGIWDAASFACARGTAAAGATEPAASAKTAEQATRIPGTMIALLKRFNCWPLRGTILLLNLLSPSYIHA